jgi:hypothetical protein
MWDYGKFIEALKSGDANYAAELGKLGNEMGVNAQNIYREILAQQVAGTAPAWYAGKTASPEAAAANFALRLAENGIGSLTELGQMTVPGGTSTEFGGKEPDTTVTINKTTGQPLPRPDLLTRGTRDLGIDYQIQFAPDGSAVPFTTERVGSGESFVKEALIPGALLLAGAYGLSAVTGAAAAGAGGGAATGGAGGLLGGTGAAGAGAAVGGTELAGLAASQAAFGGSGAAAGLLGGAGLTAEQLAAANALGGAEVAGGLTAAEAASAGLGGGVPAAAAGPGYYNEITGQFVPDANGGLLGPLTDASGTNLGSMAGYSYDPVTQTWTDPTGVATTSLTGVTNSAVTGRDLLTAAGAGSNAGGLLSNLNPSLVTGALNTAAGLFQSAEDRAAAEAAATSINAATQQAVQGAQFRPIGTTTRFGSSNFQYDPVTGQMTGAGYQLSPEARAQQDRFMALANNGITQAEGAQQAFAPLQTGAQSLFNLGNQYLAQSPQDVAQNYINQQMSLLQPGRELELANLQNRLQQQGRAGLSVAQGGTFGATTPELQALYNARAQQEAMLGANAQQAGQQNVLFGAGLLGTGATTLGNYYAGQAAAYAPYRAAMGEVTALENLGQQPFTMSTGLANQVSQAGARAGELGLRGANSAANISMGRAATTDPFAQLLAGLGSNSGLASGITNSIRNIWGN